MMGWRKRPDGVRIKFSPINKNSNIGAKIEYIGDYAFLATVYITNANQSNYIVIGENTYSTLIQAKQYCDKILKNIFETAWGMFEG